MPSTRTLTTLIGVLLCGVLRARGVQAQPLGSIDRITPLPAGAARTTASVASWVTLGADVALDLKATWDRSECGTQQWGACASGFEKAGLRIGVTEGAVLVTKWLVHRRRPCAPDCGIDAPDQSFFSGHTALAFSTLGGPRLAIALPLAVTTGGLRWAAGKHWPTDVAAGALVGWATSYIR